ncbi:WecB/TagA/CpsF family glycosyltransferase [Pseudorhodoplanes sp.]|uniref:WecB/TagA/CpsF family glycosyltransferase n=1 Tax=Pseudorhodoplanes sp. TaxID=1934341 RepID=UPI002C1861BB|nr:WecB/TagA/CpsF family glycosyltransferase [Pseudorhodoplanes sp.]HWV51987.1 WecB/TagA/CpsF family glycosyltransferase [Pseudorhodoplanes sp.]
MRARDGLVEIDGQVITTRDLTDSVAAITRRLRDMRSFLVCTLNLDHLVKLRTDARFREAYAKAEIVMPDGFPIVAFARMEGVALERATGSDLIVPLCRAAASLGHPVYLLGSTFETLCASARRLSAMIPGLQIAGVFAPSRNFDIASAEADEAIAAIAQSGARICLVALGAPRQELFAARAVDETTGVAFLGIGASLDFIAGTQTRCPQLFRKLNLEWAWRAASNPRRLVPRYAACAALFAQLYARYTWRNWRLVRSRT